MISLKNLHLHFRKTYGYYNWQGANLREGVQQANAYVVTDFLFSLDFKLFLNRWHVKTFSCFLIVPKKYDFFNSWFPKKEFADIKFYQKGKNKSNFKT